MRAIGLAILFSIGLTGAATAELDFLQSREYRHCMQLTRTSPNEAFERALSWQDAGGGPAAKHCAAVALMSLGHYKEAATRLEKLAKSMPDDAPGGIVADILGHAGIAWQQAGDPTKAYAVQTAALELSPKHTILLADRAMTLIDSGKPREALADLDKAVEVAPDDPQLRVFRGSAHRQLGNLDRARADLGKALTLKPDHPEGLLERGIVHRLQGRKDAARQDWLKLIELHEGRPAADLARRNLEKLDLQMEKPETNNPG